jgi:desulfoferrodoxin (superoxide reductase-like protein)
MKWNVAFSLVFLCFLVSILEVNTAFADVPVVNGIVVWTRSSDNHTILNITLTHHNYFAGHYVDWVKVDVGGITNTMNLSEPQPDSTFITQFDLGLVSDTPTAQAMANCIIHGPSVWSEPVTVPEFSAIYALLLLIASTSVMFLVQMKRKRIR